MEQIDFEGIQIQVQRRLFQRSLNLLIKPSGQIKITAGKSVSQKNMLKFLTDQKQWLLKNLEKINSIKNKFPCKKIIEGESILFLGRHLPIKFQLQNKKRPQVQIGKDAILIFKNKENTAEDIKKYLKKFYKTSGTEILTKVLSEKSKLMGLEYNKVSFRAQKTRWGSCSSEGNISLNWKLIFCPPDVLEYVVIHELSHLKFLNHSVDFWNLVSRFSPNYKSQEAWLKSNYYEIESYEFIK